MAARTLEGVDWVDIFEDIVRIFERILDIFEDVGEDRRPVRCRWPQDRPLLRVEGAVDADPSGVNGFASIHQRNEDSHRAGACQ
jgi:hypothetical protein